MRLSDRIHADLRDAILRGEYTPGDALPSEREFAERLAVNRHAVREALKRLQQARLVEIAQGGATRVLDWRRTGGLDLLPDLGPAPDPETLRSVLEMRASIGSDVARRFAERAGRPLRREAAALAERLEDGTAPVEAYAQLWDLLVDGSQNLAYRLALNSLMAGLAGTPGLEEELAPGPADAEHLRALAVAVRDGDGRGAAEAARALLDP